MIRMSEIIKLSELSRPEEEPKSEQAGKHPEPSDISENVEEHNRLMSKLYNQGLTVIENVLRSVRGDGGADFQPAADFTKLFLEAMLIEAGEQLTGFYRVASIENYLPSHSVNVSVLSMKIGLWLGMNKSELRELTVAGFLHDIGMARFEDIVLKDKKLGMAERKQVERHPEYGESIIKEAQCLNEDGLLAVRTHHKKGPRHRFSQIIGLADIYEAITHPRPYKQARPPHQAIKEIIETEAMGFQPDIVRAFIDNIGIYPLGSWVRISTGEIGVVVEINKKQPLSPKVSVIFNHSCERLKYKKIMDFSEEPYYYIEGPIDIAGYDAPEANSKRHDGAREETER